MDIENNENINKAELLYAFSLEPAQMKAVKQMVQR